MVLIQNVQTGCVGIDRSLRGGIPPEYVTMIYGEPETGKTTFAMQCAVNCAHKGYKTLFVDCDGTFSVERLSQLAHRQIKEVAEMIILVKPTSFKEQIAVVESLTEILASNFRLVVFDTITSLYRLGVAEFPSKAFELNRELNKQAALLAQTARTRKIALLLTSQVCSIIDDTAVSTEPVAKRVMRFWADVVIALKPTENATIIQAVLEKSPEKLNSSIWQLKIDKNGIHDFSMH